MSESSQVSPNRGPLSCVPITVTHPLIHHRINTSSSIHFFLLPTSRTLPPKKRKPRPHESQTPTRSCSHAHPALCYSTQFTASTLPWLLVPFLWKSSFVFDMTEMPPDQLALIIALRRGEGFGSLKFKGLCDASMLKEVEINGEAPNINTSVNRRPRCFIITREEIAS